VRPRQLPRWESQDGQVAGGGAHLSRTVLFRDNPGSMHCPLQGSCNSQNLSQARVSRVDRATHHAAVSPYHPSCTSTPLDFTGTRELIGLPKATHSSDGDCSTHLGRSRVQRGTGAAAAHEQRAACTWRDPGTCRRRAHGVAQLGKPQPRRDDNASSRAARCGGAPLRHHPRVG
jgi:hypothetical protein